MAAQQEQARKRTPFSAKLPQVAFNQAVPIAEALAALGAPATPHVIAQQMGTTYSSSGFKTKLAAAGYYGLLQVDGDRRTLTDRGEALTSGDEARARQARREGVMSTNFGPVIYSLRGRAINEATVALRLQSDLQVPESSARNVAKALIESARNAELLTGEDRLDAAAIEGVASVIPKPSVNGTASSQAAARPQQAQRGKQAESKPKPPREEEEKKENENTRPFGGGVQVVVKVDASNLTPEQIVELVWKLQQPPTTK